ncbi:MAG: AzlD domain-containing protein [Clostridia bacterium]|nr:AzlD domain-containing protein [Clostridia bacterium]
MSVETLFVVFAGAALITFGLRALPFVLFGRSKEVPAVVRRLGDLLPFAVIAALVVYCLKDLTTNGLAMNLKTLLAVAVVSGMHLWKKNTILSVAVGTVCYMLLLRI